MPKERRLHALILSKESLVRLVFKFCFTADRFVFASNGAVTARYCGGHIIYMIIIAALLRVKDYDEAIIQLL